MDQSCHHSKRLRAPSAIRPRTQLGSFTACRRGGAAVEFGVLVAPLVMMLLGTLQFIVFQYTQITLNNALYETAGAPEAEVTALVPDKAGYTSKLCGKVMNTGSYCVNNILVEMAPLAAYPTARTPIQGVLFLGGASKTPMMIRASLPAMQFVPFIPQLITKSSVVFVKP